MLNVEVKYYFICVLIDSLCDADLQSLVFINNAKKHAQDKSFLTFLLH